MDSFLDKLGVHDFFNLIGAGGVFLGGLHIIGVIGLNASLSNFSTGNGILDVALFIGVCFLIGTVLQQAGAKICKRGYKNRLMNVLLSDTSKVLENKFKRKEHTKRADNLLSKLGVKARGADAEARFEYYFCHCEHAIHVYGKDSKTERMRNLRGLTSALMSCFFILSVIAALKAILCLIIIITDCNCMFLSCCMDLLNIVSGWRNFISMIICCVFFSGMTVLNRISYQKNTLFWMQMVLDVYMASTDSENNYILGKES